uniref:GS catalytic domain-containing protein n=2 Tax=Octactis speculum TaxID=3111310 RepID=A0A7S2DWN0_9STRA
MGSTAGMKHDAFIDPDWSADGIPGLKPFIATMPKGRLFTGETDGSSFPNGGLRVTHKAAAFTSWDRGSPPFIYSGTCFIPCAFVTHTGFALDDKTPLLRAEDAVNREGLRLLKNIGGYEDVKRVVSYLGWEQEFFITSKEAYLARPDLRACGRTLMGCAPTKGQQMDLNYFSAMPLPIKACMDEVQAELLKLGCPLNVYHNEVAPAQHEICPFFTITNVSSDLNQIAMQICCEIAAKYDLVFLFHEKPFAGINGSGKHNNWSIGTDTGLNFFSPGKTEKTSELFAVGLACLTYAVNQHNTVIRNSVAHAGNDHRLGAQEAPPAIISLFPGTTFEAKIDDIISGGPLAGYFSGGTMLDAGCTNLNEIETGMEDRNRTAPFPFCGNRFEFRAVGSSQNCGFPMAMVNTVFADGMRQLNELIEGGKSVRDACAQMFEENKRVIFCGNGYSAEWPVEAEKRGLPNLRDAVSAASAFATPENKALFERMKVFSAAEVDCRAECFFENYCSTIEIEASTMVDMIHTGVEPALATDLSAYAIYESRPERLRLSFTKRVAAYEAVSESVDALEQGLSNLPEGAPHTVAEYCRDVLLPKMLAAREACDASERLVRKDLWPFPTYTDCCYKHHFNSAK